MGGRGSSYGSTQYRSEMEKHDVDITNYLRKAGIPEELILTPKRRVVKAGNTEFDMNEMTDTDVKGYLQAFASSRDGVQRVLNNYKNKDFNKLDKDQVKFYNDMKASKKNLDEAVKVFEKERDRRKL